MTRITIETLTPVHVGTGETLAPAEYYLHRDSSANHFFVVPEIEKLFEYYPREAEQFSQRLERANPSDLLRTSFADFAGTEICADPEIARYSIPPLDGSLVRALREHVGRGQGEVRAAIKTPDFRAYIPGSSIKGALRTAWLYDRVAEGDRTAQVVEMIERERGNANRTLGTKVFQSPANDRDVAFDLFRAVRVVDTEAKPADDALALVGIRVLSAAIPPREAGRAAPGQFVGQFKDYWIFAEAVDERMDFQGGLSVDERILHDRRSLNEYQWSEAQRALSVEALGQAANRFSAAVCAWEAEYFDRIQPHGRIDLARVREFYTGLQRRITGASDKEMYLSLGYGSGWQRLTIGLLLERMLPRERFADLRRALGLAPQRDRFEFPKSRKLAMVDADRAYRPLGWVKITLGGQ